MWLQAFRLWRQVQQQDADASLLRELQLMHKAGLHHARQLTKASLLGWAQAATAAKEQAASEARKAHTWAKIQGWLAEETAEQIQDLIHSCVWH